MAVLQDTLQALANIQAPGTIVDLTYEWRTDDVWKDSVMRPKPAQSEHNADSNDDANAHEDDRVERFDTPQYQNEADADAAMGPCTTCVFLEESA